MKKKLLFVIDSLHSGGAEKSLISLLHVLDYDHYDVDLLLFSKEGLYLPLLPSQVRVLDPLPYLQIQQKSIQSLLRERRFSVLVHRIGRAVALRNPISFLPLHPAQINWKWLSKGMEPLDEKYDVAVAYSQGMPTYYVATKVCAKRKLAWVNTDYEKARYHKKFDEFYYLQFDYIVAVSKPNKETFMKSIPSVSKKVKVINDLLGGPLIQKLATENLNKLEEFSGFKILTIGRLVEVKGYDLAIETCALLKERGLDFKWYVLGDGPLKRKLKNKVKQLKIDEEFFFLGTTTNPFPIIEQCDVYVQTSLYEGFGLAIAEARLCNKPIISTNFTGVEYQIKHQANGFIVNRDPIQLANTIQLVLQDEKVRNRIIETLKMEKKENIEGIEKFYDLIGDGL